MRIDATPDAVFDVITDVDRRSPEVSNRDGQRGHGNRAEMNRHLDAGMRAAADTGTAPAARSAGGYDLSSRRGHVEPRDPMKARRLSV
jgi:hypothetical protein